MLLEVERYIESGRLDKAREKLCEVLIAYFAPSGRGNM